MPGVSPAFSQRCRIVLILQLGGRRLRPVQQWSHFVLCEVGVAEWLLGRGHSMRQGVLFAHLEWANGRACWTMEEGQRQSTTCVMEKLDWMEDYDSGPAGKGAALEALPKFCLS